MRVQTSESRELLTQPQLADETGVPERTLAQWRYLGRGPAYIKVGHHVRYRRSDIDAWLDSQRVTTGGDAA